MFWDVITDDHDYDPDRVLLEVFPNIPAKQGTFFPGYKYLKNVGLTSIGDIESSKYCDVKSFFTKYESKHFRNRYYTRSFINLAKGKSAEEIVSDFPVEKAAAYLPFLDTDCLDLEVVKKFLIDNFEKIFDKSDPYSTFYKKLAVLYDRVRNGFHSS